MEYSCSPLPPDHSPLVTLLVPPSTTLSVVRQYKLSYIIIFSRKLRVFSTSSFNMTQLVIRLLHYLVPICTELKIDGLVTVGVTDTFDSTTALLILRYYVSTVSWTVKEWYTDRGDTITKPCPYKLLF